MPGLRSILIINPNTTPSMTNALKPLVDSLGYSTTAFTFFTAPTGPASINSPADCIASTEHCMRALPHLLPHHDAFVVACYSAHPLVDLLRRHPAAGGQGKAVVGIFEASVLYAAGLCGADEQFAIVTTGKAWEEQLTAGVAALLGGGSKLRGVGSTGLSAAQLHEVDGGEVRRRLKEATAGQVRGGGVKAVCLGCAGMAGMGEWVREALIEELGFEEGRRVNIVDGVMCGASWLEGCLRMKLW